MRRFFSCCGGPVLPTPAFAGRVVASGTFALSSGDINRQVATVSRLPGERLVVLLYCDQDPVGAPLALFFGQGLAQAAPTTPGVQGVLLRVGGGAPANQFHVNLSNDALVDATVDWLVLGVQP